MKNTQGMTFVGMLLTMAIVIIGGLLLLRIVPVYIEHYEIKHSLQTLNSLPKEQLSAVPSESEILIKKSLFKQFEVNSINDIKDENIIIKQETDNKMLVTIKYQAIRHFIANISLLFDFEDSQEVTIAD